MKTKSVFEKLLPPSSFVYFDVYKASRPSIAWENENLAIEGKLEDYAYFLPLLGDPPDSVQDSKMTVLGERYGGEGIGANGGGVRCGISGSVQVKGIGQNQLAGIGTDFFHSYGGASLNEGIVEAIWGEILQVALPFGAARVFGLIQTDTRVPLLCPEPGRDPTTARALILRQPPLRPAHYMRSIYFEPSADMKSTASDTLRTKLAIQSLPKIFSLLFGEKTTEIRDVDYVNNGLKQIFSRAAQQIASARAKRVMHGSLMGSNISIDGSWLDFSTTSSMPDYGHIIISPRTPSFIREEETLLDTIVDLQFYALKYLEIENRSELVTSEDLWNTLISQLDSSLQISFLKLTGVSESRLDSIDFQTRSKLYNVFLKIIRAGNNSVYTILSCSELPERTGRFHLNTAIRVVSLSESPKHAHEILADVISDVPLRDEFVTSYWNFRKEYLKYYSLLHPTLVSRFMILNAIRVNLKMDRLFRANLYRAVEELIQNNGDVKEFISANVRFGMTVMTDSFGGEMDVSDWFGVNSTYHEMLGFVVGGKCVDYKDAIPLMRQGILSHHEQSWISNYD